MYDELTGLSHHFLFLVKNQAVEPIGKAILASRKVRKAYGDLIDIHLVCTDSIPEDLEIKEFDKVLRDPDQLPRVLYGTQAEAGMILIRPDGYIGFQGETSDIDAVLKHISSYMSPHDA